jgi:hypothetical protein
VYITTTALPQAFGGVPFSAQLAVAGGVPAYRWSFAGILPTGLTFDPYAGVISGTPPTGILAPYAGGRFHLTCTDAIGATASADLDVDIRPGKYVDDTNSQLYLVWADGRPPLRIP